MCHARKLTKEARRKVNIPNTEKACEPKGFSTDLSVARKRHVRVKMHGHDADSTGHPCEAHSLKPPAPLFMSPVRAKTWLLCGNDGRGRRRVDGANRRRRVD
eukprot:2015523-Pleurochrysis_carterae.AAC.1